MKSSHEKLSGARDRVKTLEAQLEKAEQCEQCIRVRDELLEQLHSHGRQLPETIKSGVAQIRKGNSG